MRSRRCALRASATVRSDDSRTPRVDGDDGLEQRRDRADAARSTNQVPCGKRSELARATPRARRVLPLPPGPVRVTIRLAARIAAERRDLAAPADELGDLAGQVGWRIERPQRARIVGRAGHHQAVQGGRLLEVLDRSQALVGQLGAGQFRT